MPQEESVRRSMQKTDFDGKVKSSFFINLVNNGFPLLFVVLMVGVTVYSKSLYTTGYVFLAIAISISLAYTLWYFVTYLFVYVLFYIKRLVQDIGGTKPAGKKL